MKLADRRGIETDVYQPAEDSGLLADVVCDRLDELYDQLGEQNGNSNVEALPRLGWIDRGVETDEKCVILDVGTGSGYVAHRIRECVDVDVRVLASDVNPHAVRDAASSGLEVFRCDLVSAVQDRSIDVVVCNPPYLPTDPDAEWDDWMEQALSGGETGRDVIEPFLTNVRRILRPPGLVYLLVSSLVDVDTVIDFAETTGFDGTELESASFPYETLVVLELEWTAK